jgi:hypothetical protein
LYNTSGLLSLGNSDTVKSTYLYNASGLLSLGGTATESLSLAYNASGLLSLGGTATYVPTYLYNASGLLTLGGTADYSKFATNYTFTATGGLNLSGSSNLFTRYAHVASGKLVAGGSSDVITTYLYNTSGLLSLGGITQAVENKFVYEAFGGLTFSNGSQNRFINSYVSSGGLAVGGQSNYSLNFNPNVSGGLVVSNSFTANFLLTYSASGTLNTGNVANYKPSYFWLSSGGLVFSNAATYQQILTYNSSGLLNLGNKSDYTIIFKFSPDGKLIIGGGVQQNAYFTTATGKINLSGSANVVTTYLYNGSGLVQTGGVGQVNYIKEYGGGGLLNVGNVTERGIDYKRLPHTGYWELIENEIAKRRLTRADCGEPFDETDFVAVNRNEAVSDLIARSNYWKVICYVGDGVCEIEIDGVRYLVNLNQPASFNKLEISPIEIHIAPGPRSDTFRPKPSIPAQPTLERFYAPVYEPETTVVNTDYNSQLPLTTKIPNDVVLANISNSRVKTMLSSPDVKNWSGEFVDKSFTITIVKTDGSTLVISLDTQSNISSVTVPQYVAPDTTRLPVTNTVANYTISQDAVLSRLNSDSFLHSISKSSWKVLKLNGSNASIKLSNNAEIVVSLI